MLYFADATIEKLIVHQVGNKHEDEKLVLSGNELIPDDELREVLKSYFFNSFKEAIYYQFIDIEGNLNSNKVFSCSNSIFNNPDEFIAKSKQIAQHLFEQSLHPKIKEGELYIVYFNKCVVDEEMTAALGIFKSENKDHFLKVNQAQNQIDVKYDIGVNINKLDKGCIIFNTEKEHGYKICMVDLSGKSKDASFWKDEFLQLQQRKDDFYQTQNYMHMFKGFVNDVFNEKNGVERADQIDMLNKTAGYFEEKDAFDMSEFENKIIENKEVINALQEYKDKYTEDRDIDMKDQFGISGAAVKKSRAQFKSVLKLDNNFHIYIHGDRSRIVKGFDPSTGLHYYQVFYDQEN
jgi:hypothetical protein